MITIDGSVGEGGGQILRTALSLSAITGTPFTLERIRAKRRRPGLQRQHLVCVKAAAGITGATLRGAELGSNALTFEPGPIRAGTYDFAIGTAGSTTLVFQTVLPILLHADAASDITLSGGTHNSMSPTFDYLRNAFLPQLARMGVSADVHLERSGFYPAGGGRWRASVVPNRQLRPIEIDSPGERRRQRIEAIVANIPFDVAEREAAHAADQLGWPREATAARTVKSDGPGNVLAIEIAHDNVTEIFTGFGERGRSAEEVAVQTVDEVRAYLAAQVPVGPHLADQLLLPMALAGGGSFVTMEPTNHTRTNITVIEKFLAVEFALDDLGGGRWRISVST